MAADGNGSAEDGGFSELRTSSVEAGIDCFDAGSGKLLWQKSHKSRLPAQDLASPSVSSRQDRRR